MALITVNRSYRLNAANVQGAALDRAMVAMGSDSRLRVVFITGAGKGL